MKNTFLLVLTACITLSAAAQTKTYNDPNAQVRAVSGFHAISVSGGIDLYLTQGNDEAVAVSAAKKEDADKIQTVVENGVLKIFYEKYGTGKGDWLNWNGWSNKKMKAYVSVKTIDALSGSGGSDIVLNTTLTVPRLKMRISGGSDFKGNVNVDDLEISQSGGSDVDIAGRAINLKVDASGGSDLNAYELSADNCSVECSGGSDISITANKEISATASGGSDINYRGNAVVKKNSSSGGSSVSKRGK